MRLSNDFIVWGSVQIFLDQLFDDMADSIIKHWVADERLNAKELSRWADDGGRTAQAEGAELNTQPIFYSKNGDNLDPSESGRLVARTDYEALAAQLAAPESQTQA